MTTNQPTGPENSDSFDTGSTGSAGEQPTWGSAPSTPPAGSGSDHDATGGTAWSAGTWSAGTPSAGTSSGTSDGPATPPGARFFDRIRSFGIVRTDPGQGRMIAGVAAGIARRYRIDPVVVRIGFVLASLFGGFGVLLYGLGWMFLPHPDGRIHAQQVLAGRVTAGFVGALLTLLAVTHHLFPFLVIALIVWLVIRARRPHHAAAC